MSLIRSAGTLVLAGALCLATGSTGLAVNRSSSAAASPGASGSIEDVEWLLSKQAVDGTLTAIDPSVHATLLLHLGEATGSGGCNQFRGTYDLGDSSLTFSPFATTLMACPDPQGSTEMAYLQNLAAVASYASDGSTLTLSDASGTAILAFDAAPESDIVGDWIVTSFNNGKDALTSPVVGSVLTVVFGPDGGVSGNAGCNHYFGGYSVDGSKLFVGPLASTQMACLSDDLNNQETAFLAAISASAGWSTDSTGLTLTAADGTKTVVASPAPTEGYIGAWEVIGLNNGLQAVVPPAAGRLLTATFRPDGQVEGSTGCNFFSGPYTATGSSITIGPLASTRAACTSPLMESQEQWYLNALQAATTWQTDAHGLSLRDATDELQVQFVPGQSLGQ